jgi:asparaginyl-tRNA synthetase
MFRHGTTTSTKSQQSSRVSIRKPLNSKPQTLLKKQQQQQPISKKKLSFTNIKRHSSSSHIDGSGIGHVTDGTSTVTNELSPKILQFYTIEQYNRNRINNTIPYGSPVVIQGWLRSIRKQGKIAFLTLNDGSNISGVQAIIDPTWSTDSVYELLDNYSIPMGSAISLKGKIVQNEKKPHESPEGWEVQVEQLEIEGICDTQGYLPKLPERVTTTPTPEVNETQQGDDDNTQEDGKKKDKKKKKKLTPEEVAAAAIAAQQLETQLSTRPSQIEQIEDYSLAPYPLQKKFQTLEFLRQHPDTRLRTNTYAAIQRVRSTSMIALHNHFANNDFVCIQTPVLTPSDCEGGGEMFRVERTDKIDSLSSPSKDDYFFHRPAYLSVSGQLYAEIAASSLRRVYSFGPTFRAENSHTSRHLAEFWMLEPEMAFATLDELCTACEASIQDTIKSLLTKPTTFHDLQFFQQRYDNTLIDRLKHVSTTPFGRITYTDAITKLNQDIADKKVEFKVNGLNWGDDLGTEHEKYLAEQIFQRPVFVTNYPAKIKPFYMKVDDDSLLESLPKMIKQHNNNNNNNHHHLVVDDNDPDGSNDIMINVDPNTITTHRNESISTNLQSWTNYSKNAQNQSNQQQYDPTQPLFKLPKLNYTNNAHQDDITKMTVACFDLLVPGMGELCGGSQREERLEVLLTRINQYGLAMNEYQWYLDLRRFGTTRHGGWGMGFERFVAYVTGTDNVRDTTLIPRAPGLMQI